MNWVIIFNRLFELIDQADTPNYFSGPRFVRSVRSVDPYHPDYKQLRAQRDANGQSSTRRDYYYDILMSLPETQRVALIEVILNDLDDTAAAKSADLRALLVGAVPGPIAVVPDDEWRAERLNARLQEIDGAITAKNYERAVSLAYVVMEGFYKAFIARRIPQHSGEKEIIRLSRYIKEYLSETIVAYPDEALAMVTHISHMVDRARNRFGEAHFEEEAARWLAVYVRDLVNTQIRLLSHFL
jgi:hypothetical protein